MEFRVGIWNVVLSVVKYILSYIPNDVFTQLGLVVVEKYRLVSNGLRKHLQIEQSWCIWGWAASSEKSSGRRQCRRGYFGSSRRVVQDLEK